MAIYRPPALDKAAPIVSVADGRITPYFQRFWQNLAFTAADGGQAAADLSGKVDKNTSTGWGGLTGPASKASFATYTAPIVSNPPTQAEVQAIATALQAHSQHLKAVIDALLTAQ